MTGFKGWMSRLNGWALSLLIHGIVGAFAALSVFGVSAAGGSGWGSGGGAAGGGGGAIDTYEASMHHEDIISGEPLGDPIQYGHLTEDIVDAPLTEEPPLPVVPFDVFAVGAADVPPPPTPPVLTDPQQSRPAPAADRSAKLPAPSEKQGPGTENEGRVGSAEDAGNGGPGGSGGGDTGGEGKGQGTGVGDGNATEVYTPAPMYPSDARRQNIQGVVLVELAIESDGSCKFEKIVESSGCESLDRAVAVTVARWKYRSASADGRPDRLTKRVRFVFKLSDKDR